METLKLDKLLKDLCCTGTNLVEDILYDHDMEGVREELNALKAELAACAAGPWQPIADLDTGNNRLILTTTGKAGEYCWHWLVPAKNAFMGFFPRLTRYAEIRPFKAENTEEANQ